MKTSAVLLALVGSASAFTAPAVPSLRTTAAPRTTMSARPEQNAAAAAIAGALLLSSPMAMPDSAFAAVAPNPYAKVRSQSRSTSRDARRRGTQSFLPDRIASSAPCIPRSFIPQKMAGAKAALAVPLILVPHFSLFLGLPTR